MVSRQIRSLDQHRSPGVFGAVVVLCLLAAGHAGHPDEYELVVGYVWRGIDCGDGLLLVGGEACLCRAGGPC